MKNNFWREIDKPIFALAPMEDVTDTVFRALIAQISSFDSLSVFMTEFISADGMCHSIARKNIIHRLYISEKERKLLQEKNIRIVAQIWGNHPENYYKAVKNITEEFNFDGIDINMGCPVNKVIKKGCCSALINNPNLAKELILAAKEATNLPISVKTRIGFKKTVLESWIKTLLEVNPASISIHGRTQKQQSKGLADWDEIAKAVTIRNEQGKMIPIIGNGDVSSIEDGYNKIKITGVDGVMIGRGIFQNPWLFNEVQPKIDFQKRMKLLWEHCMEYQKIFGEKKNFNILRRFFKIYISNFKNSSFLRNKLLKACSIEEVEALLILANFKR